MKKPNCTPDYKLTGRFFRRRPARALYWQCRGLVLRFNRLRRLHPKRSRVSSREKLINFMHFHNSSSQNRDHHIFLMMNGNAYKERILPQIIVTTCEGERIETPSKLMVATKRRLFSQLQK